MKRFLVEKIREIQFELTSYCNARCPQCTRNINGGPLNPYFPLTELSFDSFVKTVTASLANQLRQIFFCGGYGEPILHSRFLQICEYVRDLNPRLYILVHSNASAHDELWWRRLAKVIPQGSGRVNFGIDGLEDTHHLHRRNTNFKKIIENAKAFISAGGDAQWSFLVFKHNEHQVDAARTLARDLGFSKFLVRRSGRFFDQRSFSRMDKWPVFNKNKEVEYFLEMPETAEFRNPSIERVDKLKVRYKNFVNYLEQTPISCDSLKGDKIIITVEGLVLPCGFLNENLYDARFYDQSHDPGAPSFDGAGEPDQTFLKMLTVYGKEKLNINNRPLEEILSERFYDKIISSWTKLSFKEGRLFECALTCGAEFNKCWDQGS